LWAQILAAILSIAGDLSRKTRDFALKSGLTTRFAGRFDAIFPTISRLDLRPDIPWVFVIVSATALGWILSNASVFFQHAAIDEERMEELACFAAPHDENKGVAVVNANGTTETVVENPCGIGDWIRENYKPWAGVLYGPLYLLCCSLPYSLIFVRRPSLKVGRQMVLLAVGILVVEWAAILRNCTAVFGERIRPGYMDQICNNVDPQIGLPLTIATAFFASWLVTAQVSQRFGRQA
jgi:hypothetical protein